jgi:hypothetical protein
MPFTCCICGEESTRICRRCTKDACDNHICEKCLRCSDCCECEVALKEPVHEPARTAIRAAVAAPKPEPELNAAPEPPDTGDGHAQPGPEID